MEFILRNKRKIADLFDIVFEYPKDIFQQFAYEIVDKFIATFRS